MDVWAYNKDGEKVYPYKGVRGNKKGLFSVNFTNDNKNFEGLTESQLINAIVRKKFNLKGTIRMLPLNYKLNSQRNAFAPKFYKNNIIKDL